MALVRRYGRLLIGLRSNMTRFRVAHRALVARFGQDLLLVALFSLSTGPKVCVVPLSQKTLHLVRNDPQSVLRNPQNLAYALTSGWDPRSAGLD